MSQTDKKIPDSDAPFTDARVESGEDIRKAVEIERTVTKKESRGIAETVAFHPVRRPPMALLCIMTDGSEDGEWIFIRKDKLVIGRSDTDVVIPHDAMMSQKHAEISRQVIRGGFRWVLTDLKSTNGSYIRVSNALLRHGQEILIGSRHYRFNAAPQGSAILEALTKPTPTRSRHARAGSK